ncbi:MAG: O-antigen ligase family protein [Phycisphaerales bacterium]|jgi:O-antigen ligase|nr:O-antigen ligase family protein [Phycisphaerales bacterium]
MTGRSISAWLSGKRQARLPALVASCESASPGTFDALNSRVCLWAACVWCFLVAFPTTAVEWAGVPLVIASLIGVRRIWRVAWRSLFTPEFIFPALFAAWQFVTLLWSTDAKLGAGQAGACRWLWSIVLLAPVMAHRRALIAALALGFLVGNASQLLHALGTHFNIAAITWNRLPGRNSGWWDPVVGGSLLTAALGLHLPTAIAGRGRSFITALLACIITLVAILATGTRGAILAAATLIFVIAILALFRTSSRRTVVMRLAVVLVLAGAGIGAAWPKIGPPLRARIDTGIKEARSAFDETDTIASTTTDTGARVAMARWSAASFISRPIAGVGAGSMRSIFRDHWSHLGMPPSQSFGHSHAHNTYLHILATTGLIGAALALAAIAIALRNALRRAANFGSYDAAPFAALVGLLLVGAFDTIHVNSQTAALLTLLLSLSTAWKPPEPPTPPEKTARAFRGVGE